MASRPGEALLVDPGSPDNLVGENWSRRQAAEAQRANVDAPTYRNIPDFNVGGVGKGSETCKHVVQHQVQLEGGLGVPTKPQRFPAATCRQSSASSP